jgi:hypothetical protein
MDYAAKELKDVADDLEEQSDLEHVPKDYVNKFDIKDPKVKAQYNKARRHKANIAMHYGPTVRRILKGEHKEK